MRLLTACIVATALSAVTAKKKKKRRRPTDDPRAAAFAAAAGGAARAAPAAAASAAGPPEAAAAAGPPPELAGHVGPELVGHVATPLLEGCTHAFLDLGANAGVQTRKLHQPKLYARSHFVPLFQKAGFYEDGAVRCAVGVEPAKEYWPRLRELAVRFNKRGMRTTFVLGGVGAANGTACFAGGNRTGQLHGTARFLPRHGVASCGRAGRRGRDGPDERPLMVATPVWDIADLLRRHFSQKSLRAVVAKVDVEGMEYKLFDRILEAGVDCAVTQYAVEWHRPNQLNHRPQKRAWEKRHDQTNRSACALSRSFDDESYSCDPWPLPSNGATDTSDWAVKSVKEHGRFWLGDGGC